MKLFVFSLFELVHYHNASSMQRYILRYMSSPVMLLAKGDTLKNEWGLSATCFLAMVILLL